MNQTARQRLERTIKYVQQNGLSGLVAASDAQNSFLEANAVFVLSGVRPIAESLVMVGRGGQSVLIVCPAWDAERAGRISATDRVVGTDDLPAAAGAIAAELGISPGSARSTGLSLLGSGLVSRIEAELGGHMEAEDDFARDLARARSSEEIALAREATRIAEAGYQALLEMARPGIREYELAAEIYLRMKAMGSEDNFLLMAASQHNLAVRAAGGRVLAEGDVILAEITPCLNGQFVQICRTAVLGEPSPALVETYALLQKAMEAGLVAAKPGITVAELTGTMNRVFAEAGYGDYCRPPYMRVRGHGLGITSNRPGDIDAKNTTVIEEGMVFVMHPNQYIPSTGYLMCGDTVKITANGAVSLANAPIQLDRIGV